MLFLITIHIFSLDAGLCFQKLLRLMLCMSYAINLRLTLPLNLYIPVSIFVATLLRVLHTNTSMISVNWSFYLLLSLFSLFAFPGTLVLSTIFHLHCMVLVSRLHVSRLFFTFSITMYTLDFYLPFFVDTNFHIPFNLFFFFLSLFSPFSSLSLFFLHLWFLLFFPSSFLISFSIPFFTSLPFFFLFIHLCDFSWLPFTISRFFTPLPTLVCAPSPLHYSMTSGIYLTPITHFLYCFIQTLVSW